jgi:hypothetical protein
LAGISNGIPQIATRDTQTTVAMREDETLIIGGLIQDTTTRFDTKIPLLGDLPLVGRAFRNESLTRSRNELIITVTPHIVTPGTPFVSPGPPLPAIPTAAPLPTLAPHTVLPRARATLPPPPARAPTASPDAAPVGPAPGATPHPSASASPAPAGDTNAFAFGQPPASNLAGPGDPVRIFAVTFAPTVVRNGTPVRFTAITTTNVGRLTIGRPGFETSIAQVAPGRWESAYNFTASGQAPQGAAQLVVTAARADGASATLKIPITVLP